MRPPTPMNARVVRTGSSGRRRRLNRCQLDGAVARAYGRVYAAVASAGRNARGRRAFDLLIAATALAFELPLYTRNPSDFAELQELIDVVAVPAS
jgi:predicted nucleic acid-binding protein